MNRVCLRCRKEFEARGRFNRLCRRCASLNKQAKLGIRKASISTGKKIYD